MYERLRSKREKSLTNWNVSTNEMMSSTESDGSSSKAESDDALEGEGEATVQADTKCAFDSKAQFWNDKASQLNFYNTCSMARTCCNAIR